MWMKIFPLSSVPYKSAYFLGKSRKGAKNKEKSGVPKTFPQSYPQKPWTALLLPFDFGRCSQGRESMTFR
jgi:hypothetical protein